MRNREDVLVKLDDRESRLALDRAAAGLLSAQIEYRSLSTSPFVENPDSTLLLRKKLEAREKLQDTDRRFKEGTISQEQFARLKRDYETELAVYDAQRSDVVATKSGLSQAREAYERAKLDLEATEIRGSFGGFIADCDLSPAGVFPRRKHCSGSWISRHCLLMWKCWKARSGRSNSAAKWK